MVTSHTVGGSGGASAPVEQISFVYKTVDVEYRPQKPDGTLDSPVTFHWDLMSQKAP